jgi:hypothetical protein
MVVVALSVRLGGEELKATVLSTPVLPLVMLMFPFTVSRKLRSAKNWSTRGDAISKSSTGGWGQDERSGRGSKEAIDVGVPIERWGSSIGSGHSGRSF